MSSLQPRISFRLAVDKLNDKEFSIFQNQWVSLLNREIISSIIFQDAIKYCRSNSKEYNLTTIMNIITDIMNQRKKSKNNNNSTQQTQLKLNKLPNVLIGETALFLPEKDYINFEVSCRQIYVSCNNPATLLYLNCTKRYSNWWKDKYSSAQHILIQTNMQLYKPCHHLNALTLNGDDCSQKHLEEFMQNNKMINTDNINTLKCEKLENHDHFSTCYNPCLNVDIFYKLLQCFPNIESLSLHEMLLDLRTIDDTILCKLLPKLRIFKATHINIPFVRYNNGYEKLTNKIINLYSNQLESLCIDYDDMNTPDYGLIFSTSRRRGQLNINNTHRNIVGINSMINLKFSKLKELKMTGTSIQIINGICSKSNVLERVFIDIWDECIDNQIQKQLIQLIIRHILLQSVEIRLKMHSWEKMIKILTNVLCEIQNINREQFKL
eukprot:133934_1